MSSDHLGLCEALGEGGDAEADVLDGVVVVFAAVVGGEDVLVAERRRHRQVPLERRGVHSLVRLSFQVKLFDDYLLRRQIFKSSYLKNLSITQFRSPLFLGKDLL